MGYCEIILNMSDYFTKCCNVYYVVQMNKNYEEEMIIFS